LALLQTKSSSRCNGTKAGIQVALRLAGVKAETSIDASFDFVATANAIAYQM
jgi:dTDP-4-amino-4,6-dideoxygalactose transaminase